MIKEINDRNFQDEVYGSEKPVVVDFWAPWCGPCRMLAPVMEELDKEYEDKIKFVKVDVDRNPEVSSTYEIHSIPTVMIFNREKIEDKHVGFAPKQTLESKLEKYL